MVQSWKIKREIARLGQQLRGIPELITDPLYQRRLDKTVTLGLPLLEGDISLSGKLALLLVFQPKGIADSTLETCRWLAAHDYAPFIVSNAPIRHGDRTQLARVVWRAVERPNFGYDFGGYRDGLTSLSQWGVVPEELLILNDSVWLPMVPENDLMERLAAEPADVAGTILRVRGTEQFLESYLYRLRRPALENPGFSAFWAELRLTSNKYHVIRRGERGFSAAMRAAGLRLAGVYDSAALAAQIAEQDDAFLRATLRYAAYVDAPLAAARDKLIAGTGPNWRRAAEAHISDVLSTRLAYSSFPYAMVKLTGYPLLKKSTEPVSRAWRLAHLAAVEASDLSSPCPATLAEIRARDPVR